MNLVVLKDPNELASHAAAEFVRIAKEAIRERGAFTVALSGGSTPLLLYKHLVDVSLDWGHVYFFFGDERNVPPDEDASNFRGANKELFRPLRIREDQIFRWRTEIADPAKVADDYCHQIVKGFGNIISIANDRTGNNISFGLAEAKFDLVLLGMGTDGHTASLFPGTAALDEREEVAVANWVPQLGTWRYTLTFPTINMARNVIFLVSGTDKADVMRSILEGSEEPDLPAKRVRPVEGSVNWFVDQAAASMLAV